MTKTGPRERRQIHWGALTILLAGAAAFVLAIWLRLSSGPTALEKLIAANAPAENVQALATDGRDLLVGSSVGVLKGSGKRWTRLPGLTGDVKAIARTPDGTLLIAGHGPGVARYRDGALQTLLPGKAEAILANAPDQWFALVDGREVKASRDGGTTWSSVAQFSGERILTLASDGRSLAAGGLQGAVFISGDGGKTWESRQSPGGSVTALLYDPSKAGRLWTCAGGAVYYSDDGAQSWRRPAKKAADRPLVALAPAPAGEAGVRGVSADGLLVAIEASGER